MKGYPLICLLAAGVVAVSPYASAAPRPADGRLAYVQYADAGCKVGIWDSKSRSSRVLGSLPECPEAVSVTSHEQVLVLIFPASIRLADLVSGKVGDAIPLPAEAVSKTRDTERSLAGYISDGSLALSLRDYAPKYGVMGRLFLYKDGAWKKTADQPCDEYEDCPFQASISARQLDDAYGVGPDGLFNESLTKDSYVVSRSVKAPHADEAEDEEEEADETEPPDDDIQPTHVTLTFHVDGKDTQLLFDTIPDQDSGNNVYTFGLKFVLPDAKTVTVTTGQYGSTLVGHYLFYHGFFGDGVRLYDVSNGEVVLDKLATGGWLEAPLLK